MSNKKRVRTQLELLELEDKYRQVVKAELKKRNIDLDKDSELREVIKDWLNANFTLRLVQGR